MAPTHPFWTGYTLSQSRYPRMLLAMQLIGPAFGRPGWSGKQLMHVWRRRQQRLAGAAQAQGEGGGEQAPAPAAVVARKGKWSPDEDEMLIRVGGSVLLPWVILYHCIYY